jgi:hypothetical protein
MTIGVQLLDEVRASRWPPDAAAASGVRHDPAWTDDLSTSSCHTAEPRPATALDRV